MAPAQVETKAAAAPARPGAGPTVVVEVLGDDEMGDQSRPRQPGWLCANCKAAHYDARKSECRMCRQPKAAPAPAPPAVQSVADLEEKLKELLAIKESMVANTRPGHRRPSGGSWAADQRRSGAASSESLRLPRPTARGARPRRSIGNHNGNTA